MSRNYKLRTLITTAMLALGGAGLGKIFEPRPSATFIVVGVVLFAFGMALQLKSISLHSRFQTKNLRKVPAATRSVLIIFLSKVHNPVPPIPFKGDLELDLGALAAEKRRQTLAGERVNYWNWEQPLRAIHHNYRNGGPLRRVILIGSRDSVEQFQDFRDNAFSSCTALKRDVALEAYFRQTKRIQTISVKPVAENGFDFEDFDELTQALADVVEQLKTDPKNPTDAKDIQIDFTGGQKPTSVVAAVVTLFSRVSNQYVATNPRDPDADVWDYDVWGYDFLPAYDPKD